MRCLQITPTNRKVNVFEGADRFEFHDNLIFNQKIEAMFTDLMILGKERNRFLSDELDAAERKFDGKGLLVNGLKKTRAKLAVDANGRRNNSIGRLAIPQLLSCFPAFLIHFQIVPAVAVSSWPGLRLSGLVAISW